MKKLLFLSLYSLNFSLCFSQETQVDSLTTNQLNEVVVTATRTERNLSSLPLPTSIITSDVISKAGVTRLNEILFEQTGLITIPDFGGVEGIQVQGLDAAYTLILIDGVPLVGRSAGTLDLSRISVGNIDRIEIVKGASSSLYGSEALAGVINIITKKPKNDVLSGSASHRYATFETHDTNANLIWKKKKFSGSVFANYFATKGYDLNESTPEKTVEPFHNFTFQPKFYYDFSKDLKLIVGTRFYNQKQDYKSIISDENYEGKSTINEWNSQVKVTQKWSSTINSEYEIYTTNYKTDEFLKDSNNQLFEDSFYKQWLFRPEMRTTISINESKLTGGIGINNETLDRSYFSSKITFNSQYAFLQYDYNPTKKWNILAGFRYDNHNQYQSQFSPKLAVNYKVTSNLSLKSSVGYGFKAPDFRQLYFDFTNSAVGYTVFGYNVAESRLNELENQGQILFKTNGINFNDALKPESSINVNLGSYFEKGKFKWETNLFYNTISNLIDTKVIAQKTNGQNVFSYFNIDKIFTYGIENNLYYNFSNDLKFSLGYQYLIAKDKSVIESLEKGEVFARDQNTLASFQLKKTDYFGLLNRSKHTANFKILYTIPTLKTSVNLRVFYRSKYGILDSNNNQILDDYDAFVKGYFLTNLSITNEITKKTAIQIGANNLFDFTNPNEISNLSGRQVFARLQFNF
jgi:outer membrane receptor for ferrienterochelin and colicins